MGRLLLVIVVGFAPSALAIEPPEIVETLTSNCSYVITARAPDDPAIAAVRFVDAETGSPFGAAVSGPAEQISLGIDSSEGRYFRAIAVDATGGESEPSAMAGALLHVDADGAPEIDYDHCKGCLVCVAVCPSHAIAAIPERHAESEGR